MRLHTIREKQNLNLSLSGAWTFFSDPRNLSLLTPPSLGLELITEPPQEMHPGLILEYRIRPLLGIPMRWVTEITHVLPLRLFVDEQRFGPYRFWHHQHLFREVPGGVEIEDLVHYALPLGPLGRAVNALVTERQIKEIFDYRRRYLDRAFGAIPSPGAQAAR